MAFDGLTINCLSKELNNALVDCRINKIAQPEPYEILFTIKGKSMTQKLLISANASLPLIYLTDNNKQSPQTAPNFCMVLRKYISNGIIKDIYQVDFERVICIEIQHLDDLGYENLKKLYIEIMGKHSNIIFCDKDDKIIDSIKHINASMSSVREVLPNREYFIPAQEGKTSPLMVEKDFFLNEIMSKPTSICKAIYTSLIGISPLIANEISERVNLDSDFATASLSLEDKEQLWESFLDLRNVINQGDYQANIIYDGDFPKEYSPIELKSYSNHEIKRFETMSKALECYYFDKNKTTNIKQKTTDIRKIVQTNLDRASKKLDIQRKQLKDAEKMDKYRLYGELLQANAYQIQDGLTKCKVLNYYDNTEVTISLDATKSIMENSNKYFDKYNKLKRTKEALEELIIQTEESINHLKSIDASIMLCENLSDLNLIRDELVEYGYIKKKNNGKKQRLEKAKPIHYVTEDGFHIYVGKNNYQNDEVTFKMATGNDWWFHAKSIHGSHVIVKCENKELPDPIFEIAASLAAYYSAGSQSDKVEIDYIQKKHIKRVASAPAGFVIYHTNYSMNVAPKIYGVTLVK